MAVTEKEFQVPVGSHTDEEFERLKSENANYMEALIAILQYVPTLWGDITVDGTFTTRISADAMYKADALITGGNNG